MAPPYQRKGVFDFMGLPPELREMIYKYVFDSDMDLAPKEVLMRKGPGMGLRYTSRFILAESWQIYLPYRTRVCHARLAYLDWVKNAIILMQEDPEDDEERIVALAANIMRLANSAHIKYERYKCHHKCPEFDSYYCDCLEHNNCFNCGRWLAMAIYCDLQQETTPHPEDGKLPRLAPLLAYFGDGDIQFTKLGRQVRYHSTKGFPKNGSIYRGCEGPFSFGSLWWAGELCKQMFDAQEVLCRAWLDKRGFVPAAQMDFLRDIDKIMKILGYDPPAWHKDVKVKHFASLSQPVEEAIVNFFVTSLKVLAAPVVWYQRVKGWYARRQSLASRFERVD